MRHFFRTPFFSALVGGAVVAVFGWVAIAAGWIEAEGGLDHHRRRAACRSGRGKGRRRRRKHRQPDLPSRRAGGCLHRSRGCRRGTRCTESVRRTRTRRRRRRHRDRLRLPDRHGGPRPHQHPRRRGRRPGRGDARLLRRRATRPRSSAPIRPPTSPCSRSTRPAEPAAPAGARRLLEGRRSATRWSRSATRSVSTAP